MYSFDVHYSLFFTTILYTSAALLNLHIGAVFHDRKNLMCNTRSFRLLERPLYQFSVVRMNKPSEQCFINCPPHWHDYIQIRYVKKGCYCDRLNHSVEKICPGTLMVLPPFRTHHPFSPYHGMVDSVCFDLSLEFLKTLFENEEEVLPFLTSSFDNGSMVFHLPKDQIGWFETLVYDLAAAYD